MLYDIRDYDIRYYDIRVLFGCEVGHPLSTYYATGRMKGGGGGSYKKCTDAYSGRGVSRLM